MVAADTSRIGGLNQKVNDEGCMLTDFPEAKQAATVMAVASPSLASVAWCQSWRVRPHGDRDAGRNDAVKGDAGPFLRLYSDPCGDSRQQANESEDPG